MLPCLICSKCYSNHAHLTLKMWSVQYRSSDCLSLIKQNSCWCKKLWHFADTRKYTLRIFADRFLISYKSSIKHSWIQVLGLHSAPGLLIELLIISPLIIVICNPENDIQTAHFSSFPRSYLMLLYYPYPKYMTLHSHSIFLCNKVNS